MPQYLFSHPETEEVIEVFQHMNDKHVYVDEDKVEWDRIFTIPQASIDTKMDPFSENAFLEKTKNVSTVGEMWDRSKDLSNRRAEETGHIDPVKKKTFNEYSKKRQGKKHIQDKD